MSDHDELASLVPEKAGSNAVIDACQRCLGYVKTFTSLQGCPPGTVMLLSSVLRSAIVWGRVVEA